MYTAAVSLMLKGSNEVLPTPQKQGDPGALQDVGSTALKKPGQTSPECVGGGAGGARGRSPYPEGGVGAQFQQALGGGEAQVGGCDMQGGAEVEVAAGGVHLCQVKPQRSVDWPAGSADPQLCLQSRD